ncbi:MAG TPA: hypothetical protein VGR29_03270 [Thermomicrobiales bacterium]|nr:hypothetical protein [Thermomicrobiales bacterium]
MVLGRTKLEQVATATLGAATLVVGASIVTDGSLAKALNGFAGLTWFASAAMFAWEGRKRGAPVTQWAGVLGLTAAVAFLIMPSDLFLATIGFGGAGLTAGLLAGRDPMLRAKMVPAFYLPMHIGTAVLKAMGRDLLGMESSIRTEPPPTAAIVPVVMLVMAMGGGWIASRIRERSRPAKSIGTAQPSKGR